MTLTLPELVMVLGLLAIIAAIVLLVKNKPGEAQQLEQRARSEAAQIAHTSIGALHSLSATLIDRLHHSVPAPPAPPIASGSPPGGAGPLPTASAQAGAGNPTPGGVA